MRARIALALLATVTFCHLADRITLGLAMTGVAPIIDVDAIPSGAS